MPVYDYKCECGEKACVTFSIKVEERRQVCKCGKEMKPVFTAPAVTFKGSGWGKD